MNGIRRVIEEACHAEQDPEARVWAELGPLGRERLRAILEESMRGELTERLGYVPYQRDPGVDDNYRNGYYSRDIDTQYGPIRGLLCAAAALGQDRVYRDGSLPAALPVGE